MKQLTITMRVMNFINDKSNLKYIKYDWDGGHSYSYIDHPIVDECDEIHELQDKLNEWLYSHDECPPCEIYIKKDNNGKVVDTTSPCGCHDKMNYDEDTLQDIIDELNEVNPKYGVKIVE